MKEGKCSQCEQTLTLETFSGKSVFPTHHDSGEECRRSLMPPRKDEEVTTDEAPSEG